MYDEEYVPGGEKERPVLVSSAEDRTAALQSAEALCVACDGATLSESALTSVLEVTLRLGLGLGLGLGLESALTSVLEVTLSACLQPLALAFCPQLLPGATLTLRCSSYP